jgi:ABC-type multidrug transport system fused ATPase/permease subunit
MEATRRQFATLRGKGSDTELAKPQSASKSFSDRLLWKLAKSDGNPEEDQLVFASLNLLKKSFQQNKKLCKKIFFWSALTSLFGVVSFYVLKIALEADSTKVGIPWLVAAAFLYAVSGRSFPFTQTFHDGDILLSKTREYLIEKIAGKLKIVHRESLRKYLNENGKTWSLANSIPKSIGSDLPVVVKDPLIWLFNVAALWFLAWEYAIALVAGCFLLLWLIKPAIRKNQEISKEAEKVASKLQTSLDTWSELPRLHSDRGISESTAQKLEDLSDQEVTIYQNNAYRRTWLVAGPRTLGVFLLLAFLFPYAVFVQHSKTIDVILLASFFSAGFLAFVSAIDFALQVADMRGELVKLGRLLGLPNRPEGHVQMQGFEGFDLQDIRIHYGDKTLFPNGLNLKIQSGTPAVEGKPGKAHKVAFVGPSGCGKSSLMDLLARNLENIAGNSTGWTGECLVHSDGKAHSIDQIDLGTYPRYIISVPQETEVLSADSVERNIGLAVEALPSEQREQIVHKLSEMMHLPLDSLDKLSQEQSGGQRKRTQIGSALAVPSERLLGASHSVALLLDEALSQLDQETAIFVLKAIEELAATCGDTIIMIAHSEYAIYDDSYVYVFGPDGEGIIEEGWKWELASDPASAYNKVFKGQ